MRHLKNPGRRAATALLVGAMTVAPAAPALQISFDYTFDAAGSNFFAAGSEARATLEAAAGYYATRIGDALTPIVSSGGNVFSPNFQNPDTGALGAQIVGLSLAAEEIVIIPGARDLGFSGGNAVLGAAGPGSGAPSVSGSPAFILNAQTRGQGLLTDVQGPTATDYAAWGGQLAIDLDTNWNLSLATGPAAGQFDLLTIALHEIAHILGIGTVNSWSNRIDGTGTLFTGPAAVAEFGGSVPLEAPAGQHWNNVTSNVAAGTESWLVGVGNPESALFNPTFAPGERRLPTDLDLAALVDVGWEVTAVPLPPAAWLFAAGTMLALRRRAHG